jgi:hypothetical protein
LLQKTIAAHPPAGLKNTHPRLRYMVQTDVSPPWFVIYGSNLKFLHWSYKRHIERVLRENVDFIGTSIKVSYRDEKQIKANREKAEAEAEKASQVAISAQAAQTAYAKQGIAEAEDSQAPKPVRKTMAKPRSKAGRPNKKPSRK